MARTTPAGNGGNSSRVFTAAEFSVDPAGVNTLGYSQNVMQELGNYQFNNRETVVDALDAVNQAYDPRGLFKGISTSRADLRPGSRAMQVRAIADADKYDFYDIDPATGRQVPRSFTDSIYQEAGLSKDLFSEAVFASQWLQKDYSPPKAMEGQSFAIAAPLSETPTSTSNYARPRTVAAGWKRDTENSNVGTLTVVFRDGTLWNYYSVPVDVWKRFYNAFSKGPMLNRGGSGKFEGELLKYSNGPATIDISDEAMRALYITARASQIVYRENAKRSGYSKRGTPGSKDGASARRVKTNLTATYQRQQAQASAGNNPNQNAGVNPYQK